MKFIFGKPTDEPFDREEEIKTLLDMIERKQPVAVIGVRRIGKTSVILKTLKAVNLPKVYISAEDYVEGKSFDLKSFLSYFSSLLITEVLNYTDPKRNLPKVIKYRGKEVIDRLRELIGYIKLSFNINLGEVELFLEKGNKSIPELLDLPQRLAEEFKVNLVIAIDEFQYLRLASQNYPGLFNVLRSKWQFHKNVSYIISGSSVGLLEHMFSNKKEPFYQFFFPVYIKAFDENASKLFLFQGFKDEGKEFEEEAISYAVKELDGIPAWLNYFGLKSLSCEKVTLECAKKAISEMYEDPIIKSAVLQEYNKLGKNARAVLKYLAEKGGKSSLRELQLSRSSLNEGIKSLINEGYIRREERGVYSIIDPLIAKVLYRSNAI